MCTITVHHVTRSFRVSTRYDAKHERINIVVRAEACFSVAKSGHDAEYNVLLEEENVV